MTISIYKRQLGCWKLGREYGTWYLEFYTGKYLRKIAANISGEKF
jgi:hypothetical protein